MSAPLGPCELDELNTRLRGTSERRTSEVDDGGKARIEDPRNGSVFRAAWDKLATSEATQRIIAHINGEPCDPVPELIEVVTEFYRAGALVPEHVINVIRIGGGALSLLFDLDADVKAQWQKLRLDDVIGSDDQLPECCDPALGVLACGRATCRCCDRRQGGGIRVAHPPRRRTVMSATKRCRKCAAKIRGISCCISVEGPRERRVGALIALHLGHASLMHPNATMQRATPRLRGGRCINSVAFNATGKTSMRNRERRGAENGWRVS